MGGGECAGGGAQERVEVNVQVFLLFANAVCLDKAKSSFVQHIE